MFRIVTRCILTALILGTTVLACWGEEGDLFDRAPWTVTVGGGYVKFEGDEEVEDGGGVDLKLGYDFNPHWTLEGDLLYLPTLKAREFEDDRYALEDDIWGTRLSLDLLFHLRNTSDFHFDPFLAIGPGLFFFEEDLGSGKTDFSLTGGGGLFIHFNDRWSVRGEVRTGIAGGDTEAKLVAEVGLTYRIGAGIPPAYRVEGGDLDSDGDGLLDTQENEIGTDPYDPDTDKDGLSDGEEVNLYQTDPLNPDSDWDGLKDGEEVITYKTDPLDQDTDDGGVADGHEVIEDNTDPLDPSDDLLKYTLRIEFDYDKADIRPGDYEDLDIIVKVLQRDPTATARVEGHADKRKTSRRDYNLELSKRRADAVADYIKTIGGIEAPRLATAGYGFDRPLAPNDTEENMQLNRRVEVYIRRSGEVDVRDIVGKSGSAAAPAGGMGAGPAAGFGGGPGGGFGGSPGGGFGGSLGAGGAVKLTGDDAMPIKGSIVEEPVEEMPVK